MVARTNPPGVPSTGAAGGLPSVPPAAAAVAPWWSPLNQQLASTRHHLAQVATQLQTASRTWKAPDFSKGLGVKLDIDMLSPAVSSVKQQYQALPEPVRDVMPFAGVACLTGVLTSKLYAHQLHQAQQRYGILRQDHEQLQAQLAQVEAQLNDSDMRRTNAHLQVQMAEAVAKATTAAAAAATAAASAAAAAVAAAPAQKEGSRWP